MGPLDFVRAAIDFMAGLIPWVGMLRGGRKEQAEAAEIEARAKSLAVEAEAKAFDLEERRRESLQKQRDDALGDLGECREEMEKVLENNRRLRGLWRQARDDRATANGLARAADERYYVLLIKYRALHGQLTEQGIPPAHEYE